MTNLQVKFYGVFVFLAIALLALGGIVPTTFIYTKPRVVGWKGNVTTLPCNFSGDPYAVFWVKLNGTDLNSKKNKAGFFNGKFNSFDERFEMKEDFSLFISELQVSDEGEYLCQLERNDLSGGEKSTNLSVYAKAEKPVIDQCDESTGCIVRAPTDSTIFTMDCRVTGFKPNLTDLVWSTAGRDISPVKQEQTRLTDGTWERVVTVTITSKNGADQNITCTATGDAVGGTASRTVTISNTFPVPPVQDTPIISDVAVAGIVIAVITVIAALLIIIGRLLWTSRGGGHRKNADDNDEPSKELLVEQDSLQISELQKKIREYIPGMAADVQIPADDVSKVNINLFGLMGIGKSSFFNSLLFAVKGAYREVSPEGCRETSGAMTTNRVHYPLAMNVNLNDNRGIPSFCHPLIHECMAQARGRRGDKPTEKVVQLKENEIHCIVFVHKYSATGWNEALSFVSSLFRAAAEYYGRSPLFVFTHGNDIMPRVTQLEHRLSHFGVPKENVFVFENYTSEEHEEDKERHLKLLKFVWKALEQCDLNMIQLTRKRGEKRGVWRAFK